MSPAAQVSLAEGDGLLVEVGGGGGYDVAFERDAEKVRADLQSGYVSIESARRDYGVEIPRQGRHYTIELTATELLRRLTRTL